MSRPPSVIVVVLNWNGCADTIICVTSLEKTSYPDRSIVIVDNGSTDGSQRILRERFPGCDLIETGENLGYAGGNNVGLEAAINRTADYVILLNNDTVVDEGFIEPLVATAESTPRATLFGAKILYRDQPDTVWFAGGRVDWVKGNSHLGKDQKDQAHDVRSREVDYVTGCCLMVRTSAIESLGMLDPKFFLLFEEADWCLRARERGWQVVYVPASHVWHAVSSSFGGQASATYRYYYARNQLLFIWLHLRGLRRVGALLAAHLREVLGAGWRAARHGHIDASQATLRGILHFWRGRFGRL